MSDGPLLFLELEELVLDAVAPDFHTLLNCRLVCRFWDKYCRPSLFQSIDLSSAPLDKRRRRFRGFSKLLQGSPSPTFVDDVQHITLNEEPRADDIQGLRTNILPNLHSLSIKSEYALSPSYFRAVSKQFPGITRLDIISIPFMMRRTLLDFICSFERLEWLAFGDPRWLGFWMDAHHNVEFGRWKLPPIKSLSLSLDLGAILEQTFLGWLLEQLKHRNTLEDLRYRARAGHPDANKALLTSVSPSIHNLWIDSEFSLTLSGEEHASSSHFIQIHLRYLVLKAPECQFTRLTTLQLGVAIDEVHYSPFGSLPTGYGPITHCVDLSKSKPALDLAFVTNVANTLSEIEAPELQNLNLRFFTQPDQHAGDFDQHLCSLNVLRHVRFTSIDNLLSKPTSPFPSLVCLTIICGPIPTSPCIEYVVLATGEWPMYIVPFEPDNQHPIQARPTDFIQTAFEKTMTRKSMTVRVLEE